MVEAAEAVNESLEVITGVSDKVAPVITKIVIAVLILLMGLILGKLLGNLIRRALNEVQLDKHLKTVSGFGFSLEKFTVSYTHLTLPTSDLV